MSNKFEWIYLKENNKKKNTQYAKEGTSSKSYLHFLRLKQEHNTKKTILNLKMVTYMKDQN